MRTPVFSADHQIRGYLDHDEAERQRPSFCRSAVKLGPVPANPPSASDSVSYHDYRVHFTWAVMGSSRGRDKTYRCDVLIADNEDALGYVRGFQFFAEAHGTRIPYVGYREQSA